MDGLIEELTPEIESGRLSATELERALSMRCWAHFEKDRLDQALADCNRVLAADPDHGVALVLRASARIRPALRAAIGTTEGAERRRRACDVVFYAGEYALIVRDMATAGSRLTEATATCPIAAAEAAMARTELSRLQP